MKMLNNLLNLINYHINPKVYYNFYSTEPPHNNRNVKLVLNKKKMNENRKSSASKFTITYHCRLSMKSQEILQHFSFHWMTPKRVEVTRQTIHSLSHSTTHPSSCWVIFFHEIMMNLTWHFFSFSRGEILFGRWHFSFSFKLIENSRITKSSWWW